MPEGNVYLRIDKRTQKAMNLLASEYVASTGKKISANTALWMLLVECREAIANKADELDKLEKKESGDK